MKNNTFRSFFLVLFILISSPYSLFGALDMYLHLKVVNIDKATVPEFYGDYIIFTFNPQNPVRFVAVIFKHEGYGIQHVYQCNNNGIFFFIYPIPSGIRKIKYRLIVDGLMMKDPANPLFERDLLGIEYSIFNVTKIVQKKIVNPQIENDGEVRFMYKSKPGRTISLVGTFNDWDPFIYIFKEAPPGNYFLTLRVSPGRYFYYFIVDGEKILDFYNPDVGVTSGGETVSFFDYP